MSKEIKYIYLGLPTALKNIVLWVAREYRTNELSHTPGGSDIIIEYKDGTVNGYDWIKFPSRYISSIIKRKIFINENNYNNLTHRQKIQDIKNNILRIFGRMYEEETDFETTPFEEIWHANKDNLLPWNKIKEYFDRIKFVKRLPPLTIYKDEINLIPTNHWNSIYNEAELEKKVTNPVKFNVEKRKFEFVLSSR